MTTQEVSQMINSIGVPYAYYQFTEDTAKPPPFICFYFTDSSDFLADDTNYIKIRPLIIELYTENKDFDLEAQVEDALTAHDLIYTKEETVIDSERMYMVIFNTEVVLTNAED